MSGEFQAGTARVEITPRVGSELIGYLQPRVSTGIRDPLYATSAVFSSGTREVALVSCDLLALPAAWVEESKRLVHDETGLAYEDVMIACTHTHTGPCTTGIFLSNADEEYLSRLPTLIARSVRDAYRGMKPASVSAGKGFDASLVFNRRYRMRDGSVRTNPGVLNPEVAEAAGPVDPEIVAMMIRDERERMLGCLFNYPNHVDVMGGDMISADYPGALAGLFRRRFGRASNLVYINGASGDVNHINVRGPPYHSGPSRSRAIAETLFSDLLEIIRRATVWSEPDVAGAVERVRLPARNVSCAEVEAAKKLLSTERPTTWDAVFAQEALLLAKDPRCALDTVVQAIAIGEMVFVGIPGEPFVEIGLKIKGGSPFAHTAVAELANDYVGYLPTDLAFKEGGYETMLARSSRVGPGTEGILTEAALGLVGKLHRRMHGRNET